MYYFYILDCADGHPYIGCSSDLRERVARHEKGRVPATSGRLPIKLFTHFAFSDKYVAFHFEKYLKTGSGRAFAEKHFRNKNFKK